MYLIRERAMLTSAGSMYSSASINGVQMAPQHQPQIRNQVPISMYYAPQHVPMVPTSMPPNQQFVPYPDMSYGREFSQGSRGSWFSNGSLNGSQQMVR